MALDATARRRWLGAAALLGALAMVVAGQSVLAGRLNAVAFFAYWLVCLGLTGAAIVVAVLDVRAIQRKILGEQRNFVQSTLKEIENEARKKSPPSNSN
jgi:hypothetical protein